MSKRMTETGKWQDRWFRSLSPQNKCLWIYLCDSCDQAGVIEPDYELIEFCIGAGVDWDSVTEEFKGKIVSLGDGKWWIPKFIKFQNGKLSHDCKPHQHIINLLDKHRLTDRYMEYEESGYKTFEESQTLLSISTHGGKPEAPPMTTLTTSRPSQRRTADHFDEFWAMWPASDRKTDKKKCLKYWEVHGLDNQWDAISKGLAIWIESDSWTKDEGQFIPMPYTWLNNARWDCAPVKEVKPVAKPVKPKSDRARYDDAVQYCAEELWSRRDDKESFKRTLSACNDKFKDMPKTNGKTVVDEALEIVAYRRERINEKENQ